MKPSKPMHKVAVTRARKAMRKSKRKQAGYAKRSVMAAKSAGKGY